jgi:hypothetical protein
MSTENAEKTEVTLTTENTTNDNKKVFGPLGKYAIVAVIMVSVIVTTAFMLNKQLGSVDEQLAAIESEVAEIHGADSNDTIASDASEAIGETQDTASTDTVVLAEVQEVESRVADDQVSEVEAVEAQAVETVSVNTAVTAENTASDVADNVMSSETGTEASSSVELASESAVAESVPATEDQAVIAMSERDQERQARIEAYKLEQKQHMTEMFARIKSLEAQRLDKYKASQDEEIQRLRERLTKQEQLIETLILRNKEWIEMREASMQRSQSYREKMLDRI